MEHRTIDTMREHGSQPTRQPGTPGVAHPGLLRVWNSVLAVVVLVAVVGQLVEVTKRSGSVVNFFSYFTVQSNLLVLVTSVWLIVDPELRSGGRLRQMVRLASLTGITVTGVVYGTLIAPFNDPSGVEWLYDVLFHYVSPVLAVLGFLLLGPRARLQHADLWFIVWPLAWLTYTMLRGQFSNPGFLGLGAEGSHYPYGFLDVEIHGWRTVSIYIALIAVLLAALAALYIWIDGVLARRSRSLAGTGRAARRIDAD